MSSTIVFVQNSIYAEILSYEIYNTRSCVFQWVQVFAIVAVVSLTRVQKPHVAHDRGLCSPQRTEGSYHYLWPALSS